MYPGLHVARGVAYPHSEVQSHPERPNKPRKACGILLAGFLFSYVFSKKPARNQKLRDSWWRFSRIFGKIAPKGGDTRKQKGESNL